MGGSEVQFPYSLSSLSKPESVGPKIFPQRPKEDANEVIYSYYDAKVATKLHKLINTDKIRILDKRFMETLQERIYQNYWTEFEQRLKARRVAESQRRRYLALRGLQPLDDGSLDKHPIIQVAALVQHDLQALREKQKVKVKRRAQENWDYCQLLTMSELESEASEVSLVPEDIPDKSKRWKQKLLRMKEEALQLGQLPGTDVVESLKYEPPLMKELRKQERPEDLYDLAEKVLNRRARAEATRE